MLNRARKALPAEPLIWITAAQLEEANAKADNAGKVIANALKVRVASLLPSWCSCWNGVATAVLSAGVLGSASALMGVLVAAVVAAGC